MRKLSRRNTVRINDTLIILAVLNAAAIVLLTCLFLLHLAMPKEQFLDEGVIFGGLLFPGATAAFLLCFVWLSKKRSTAKSELKSTVEMAHFGWTLYAGFALAIPFVKCYLNAVPVAGAARCWSAALLSLAFMLAQMFTAFALSKYLIKRK